MYQATPIKFKTYLNISIKEIRKYSNEQEINQTYL